MEEVEEIEAVEFGVGVGREVFKMWGVVEDSSVTPVAEDFDIDFDACFLR